MLTFDEFQKKMNIYAFKITDKNERRNIVKISYKTFNQFSNFSIKFFSEERMKYM